MNKLKLLAGAGIAALLATTSLAQALVITVTGSDGISTVSNSGGSPVNYGPASVGTWTAQGTASGTPPSALGDLFSNTIAVNTGAAGTFTLWVTENGLTGPLGNIGFVSGLTTNFLTGGVFSVQETTSIQTNNTTPGPGVLLGTILDTDTFTTDLTTSSATIFALTGPGPYSLTEQFIVRANAAGSANLSIDLTTVPEPASILLMGTGVLGVFGLLSWIRRRDAASTNMPAAV